MVEFYWKSILFDTIVFDNADDGDDAPQATSTIFNQNDDVDGEPDGDDIVQWSLYTNYGLLTFTHLRKTTCLVTVLDSYRLWMSSSMYFHALAWNYQLQLPWF